LNLYLLRHGIATWVPGAWQGDDDKRPLTPEGIKQLIGVGEALALLGVRPQFILHSPLVRAADTARYIAKALAIPGRLKEYPPLRSLDATRLGYLLREYAQCEELMVVGHLPDMANAVKALTGGEVKFIEGTVAHIKVSKHGEAPRGTLVWLAPAEMLMKMGHSE
jgi:phosphohistidine phosphatase